MSETPNGRHAQILSAIAEELRKVKEHMQALLDKDAARVGVEDVRQALSDVLSTYALLGQLVNVYEGQKDAVDQLGNELRAYMERAETEREEIADTLAQLRETARKHYAALQDLERAIYGGETRAEQQGRKQRERANGAPKG